MADGRHTRGRLKMGVLVPSTNTSVQPEYDAMRPPGVTNHVRGLLLPNMPTRTYAEYQRQLEKMRATQVDAMDGCSPVSPTTSSWPRRRNRRAASRAPRSRASGSLPRATVASV